MGEFICQNCDSHWNDDQLDELDDVLERVMPGDTMPDGQCPDCGAVCFEFETPEYQAAERIARAAPDLLAALEEFVADVRTAYIGTQDDEALYHSVLAHEWPDLCVTFDKAVAAIAKARGTVAK